MEIALSKFSTDQDVVTLLAPKNYEDIRGGLGRRNKHSSSIKNHCTVPQLINFLDDPDFKEKDIFKSYFKFTILRDPVDTFISHYFFMLKNTKLEQSDINQWIKDLKVSGKPDVVTENWQIFTLNNLPIVDDYIYYSKDSGPGSRMYQDCERISKKLNLPENLADIFCKIQLRNNYREREAVYLNEESIEFIKQVSQKQLGFTGMKFNPQAFNTSKSII